MIGRNVQNSGDGWMKGFDILQLIARYFQDDAASGGCSKGDVREGGSNIPRHKRRLSGGFKHLSHKRRRGRLPVGSRYRNKLLRSRIAAFPLQFPPDWNLL